MHNNANTAGIAFKVPFLFNSCDTWLSCNLIGQLFFSVFMPRSVSVTSGFLSKYAFIKRTALNTNYHLSHCRFYYKNTINSQYICISIFC